MGEYIFVFGRSGGLFVLMFVLFLCGLALKVMAGIYYDSAVKDAALLNTGQCSGVVRDIVNEFGFAYSGKKECKNTAAYVDNCLHKWRKCGIVVERFDDLGSSIAYIDIFLGVVFDMFMLINKTFKYVDSDVYMRYVYVYSMITIIIFISIRGFGTYLNIENKRIILRDLLVDYLDNHFKEAVEYVKLDMEKLPETKDIEGNDNEKLNHGNNEMDNKKDNEKCYDNELDKNDKERVIFQVLDEFLAE